MPEIKKQPVRAKLWQVSILKKMHEEHPRPSLGQRYQLAVETGLDNAWIKDWFRRQNKKMRNRNVSTPTQPESLPISKTKSDLSLPEGVIQPNSWSTSLSPSPLHPVSSQETSDIPPSLDVLLASLNGQADEDHGFWAGSTRILAPTPRRTLPSVDFFSLGCIPDASRSTSHLSMEEELTQGALPQHSSTWLYSRDPLHGRYPDFSNFFSPTPCDTLCDTGRFLELSPVARSPMTDDALGFLSLCYTIRSPDHFPAIMHSPIASSVSFRASLSDLSLALRHTPKEEQPSDVIQDSPSPSHPVVEAARKVGSVRSNDSNYLHDFKSLQNEEAIWEGS